MRREYPGSKERVRHVIEAIENIQEFSRMHTYESFKSDGKTSSACLFQFSIIGEATRHIDGDILAKYQYPWHHVKSFRNFDMHEYFGIDLKVVWDTITDVLPELSELMNRILKEEYSA